MRNTYLKEIRHEFKDSRFFFGKNRVMAKALGTTPEEEYKEGLSAIAKVSLTRERKRKNFKFFDIVVFVGVI